MKHSASLRTCFLALASLLFVAQAHFASAEDESKFAEAMKAGQDAYRNHDNAQAEASFAQALEEAEKFGKEDKRVAEALNFVALITSGKGDYAQALNLQKRALDIDEKAFGKETDRVAVDVTHLATFQEANKQRADAEANFKNAVAIKQKAFGKDSPEVAVALCTLADFYVRQKQNANAEAALKNAIDTYIAAGKSGATLQTSERLIELYKVEHKNREIEQVYTQEIARQEKNLGSNSLTLAGTLLALADHYTDLRQYAQAESALRHAFSIQRESLGDDRTLTAQTMFDLALCLTNQRKFDEAEPMYKKAMAVFSHTRQRGSVPDMMSDYAECLEKNGRRADASKIRAQAKAFQ